jgi:hypothetical protein
MSGPSDEPDIEIGAVVRAKKLRFKKTPKTDIRFRGEPKIESGSGSKRENLPDKVEPNKTYRDVYVRWGAAVKLKPPDREDVEAAIDELNEDLKEEKRD